MGTQPMKASTPTLLWAGSQKTSCVSCYYRLRLLYGYTEGIEAKFQAIRDKDFARLDEQKCAYLDYTGAMLAPKMLVDEHSKLLLESVLGNPHSENTPSIASTKLDEQARQQVLEFCKADPNEYEVIWTANASGASSKPSRPVLISLARDAAP
jgi:selenocysteine lyase/cysteine desulfurase